MLVMWVRKIFIRDLYSRSFYIKILFKLLISEDIIHFLKDLLLCLEEL